MVATKQEAKVTYDVRVLGTLWMPGVQAAQHVTIPETDLADAFPADGRIFDPDVRTLAASECEKWCDTHLGDFASIDALDIRRVEVREDFESFERDGSRVEVVGRETTFTQLREFNDDEEQAWHDAMFPCECEECD